MIHIALGPLPAFDIPLDPRVFRVVHPFPSLLNAAATVGLAFAAADGSPDAGIVVRMAIAMLCAQFAIGAANDVFDRELDAKTKPWKPIAAGLISARIAGALVVVLVVAAFVLAATLGTGSLGLMALGTACGLAYDAGLKRTLFSALPFMVAIPTLPVWVYVTFGASEAVLWWLLPLGALIGLAVHLANTAPDIAGDAAHGVRGLAHRLGERRALLVSWASFAVALAGILVLWPWLDADDRWYAAAIGIGVGCLAMTIGVYGARLRGSLQFNFAAMSVGAVAAAGGWLAAVT